MPLPSNSGSGIRKMIGMIIYTISKAGWVRAWNPGNIIARMEFSSSL
jgi:hypothetical protein